TDCARLNFRSCRSPMNTPPSTSASRKSASKRIFLLSLACLFTEAAFFNAAATLSEDCSPLILFCQNPCFWWIIKDNMLTRAQEFYIGVDGGGTKTHAIVVDIEGNIHGEGRAGASNPIIVGLEESVNSIFQAITRALREPKVQLSQ